MLLTVRHVYITAYNCPPVTPGPNLHVSSPKYRHYVRRPIIMSGYPRGSIVIPFAGTIFTSGAPMTNRRRIMNGSHLCPRNSTIASMYGQSYGWAIDSKLEENHAHNVPPSQRHNRDCNVRQSLHLPHRQQARGDSRMRCVSLPKDQLSIR